MKKIEEWIAKLNSNQKFIIAIGLPLTLFIATFKIAGIVGENYYGHEQVFRFDKNWWVWFLFGVIVVFLEYKLFGNKKDE